MKRPRVRGALLRLAPLSAALLICSCNRLSERYDVAKQMNEANSRIEKFKPLFEQSKTALSTGDSKAATEKLILAIKELSPVNNQWLEPSFLGADSLAPLLFLQHEGKPVSPELCELLKALIAASSSNPKLAASEGFDHFLLGRLLADQGQVKEGQRELEAANRLLTNAKGVTAEVRNLVKERASAASLTQNPFSPPHAVNPEMIVADLKVGSVIAPEQLAKRYPPSNQWMFVPSWIEGRLWQKSAHEKSYFRGDAEEKWESGEESAEGENQENQQQYAEQQDRGKQSWMFVGSPQSEILDQDNGGTVVNLRFYDELTIAPDTFTLKGKQVSVKLSKKNEVIGVYCIDKSVVNKLASDMSITRTIALTLPTEKSERTEVCSQVLSFSSLDKRNDLELKQLFTSAHALSN